MTEVHAIQEVMGHPHDHNHASQGAWSWIAAALHLPGYTHAHENSASNDLLYTNELGIRTVKLAFVLLGLTTLVQILIFLSSGSAALLADGMHNLADTLNSVPLWIAFALMRRTPRRGYTYGYGRAEDLAGLFVVASIVFSALYSFWESFQKLINPQPITHSGWVSAAALIGFAGNEAVALLQIRVGRQIGSAAMIADGRHAQADGLTSLAVIGAVIGTAVGFPALDGLIGIFLGIAILFIARDAISSVWYRLMDAVDPSLLESAMQVLTAHHEIKNVVRLQMRWVGHQLQVSLVIALDEGLTLAAAEDIAQHIRHHLAHDLPYLADVLISTIPARDQAQLNP